ncbi:MAG: multicopper oxidase domain-containing protein [Flavobacteriales bacterium]|nr:multicopper oxidase domain-containing protein [Flavobacteriales bacterium]
MQMKTCIPAILLCTSMAAQAQNPLAIPPALTGTSFNLDVQTGTRDFYGTPTPTYGINGPFLGPTIIVHTGDSIQLNVTNNLPMATTMHWHGMHVSAMNDGGPHQPIAPGATWSPSFTVRNHAGTYWYHPHGAGQTERQVAMGLAGFFLVKDEAQAALNLPRTYGVDDIPLAVQTRAFDVLTQIASATDMDTAVMVNGTLHAAFDAPAQVLRFRLLNGNSMRSLNFGFSNGQTFYQIATDGGLKDAPLALSRLMLSPGERAEVLLDLTGMQGQSVQLMSFASELPDGVYGAANVGAGADTIHEYHANFLNGADFSLLQIHVVAPTASPVTTVPATLVPYVPYETASATHQRTIVMDTLRLLAMDTPNRAHGPFGLNGHTFSMDSINEVVPLNAVEVWTIVNKTLVAHPFHMHDIQFNIIEKSGVPPPASETGWKDVVVVMPGDSAKFITQFTTFADDATPYMYHCHLLHHEDDGMMGSFLVVDTSATAVREIDRDIQFTISPNPATDHFIIHSTTGQPTVVHVYDVLGKLKYAATGTADITVPVVGWECGVYVVRVKAEGKAATRKLVVQRE